MRILKRLRGYIALSLVWVTVLCVGLWIVRRPATEPIQIVPPPTSLPTLAPTPSVTPGPLRVDVAGAVKLPGVYALPRGSLVAEAIAAAGGPADNADLDRVNKALVLQDGVQVFVPRIAQPAPTLVNASQPTPLVRSGQTTLAISGGLININTATLAELDTLPGVGPAIAQRIIENRPYGAIEDLMRVRGIAQVTFDNLKDFITIR